MIRKMIPAFALLALAAPLAMAADDETPFLNQAWYGNQTEIELGKYVGDNAADNDVKNFGWKMQTDHTKAQEALQATAKKSGMVLPTALDKHHQDMLDRMMKLKGAELDKAYMKMMLTDHKQDIKQYENGAKNGKTADIKAYAQSQLPILRQHLEEAQQVASKVGVKGGGAAASDAKKKDKH